jgi:HNH endonuclease
MPVGDRFSLKKLFARVDVVPDSCWMWTGPLSDGYGRTGKDKDRDQLVHRIVYKNLVGPIPDGFQLDHLCRNRACCNPAHLEPVTQKVNLLRGEGACAQHARKTHCKRGHEFTPENTGNASKGGRYCITCSREAARRQREKNHKGKRPRSIYQPRPFN